MKLQAVHDRMIVKRIRNDETTEGGILLPDPDLSDKAEVLGVGPGQTRESGICLPCCAKVGDIVIIGKYAGTSIKLDGEELWVIRDEDVLAKIPA